LFDEAVATVKEAVADAQVEVDSQGFEGKSAACSWSRNPLTINAWRPQLARRQVIASTQ
jgi:hypothetical protein